MTVEDWCLVGLTIALVFTHLGHSYYEAYMVLKNDPKTWYMTAMYNVTGFLQTVFVMGIVAACIMRFAARALPA